MRDDLNAAWLRFRDDTDAWCGHPHRSGAGLLRRRRHQGRRLGGHLRGHVLGKAHHQLVRERLGTVQAHHRGRSTARASATALPACRSVISSSPRSAPPLASRRSASACPPSSAPSACPAASAGPTPWNCCSSASPWSPPAPRKWGWCGRWCRTTTCWPKRKPSPPASANRRRWPCAPPKEVAVRTRSLPWIEAVRFGETMRLVAGETADATEGKQAFRGETRPGVAGEVSCFLKDASLGPQDWMGFGPNWQERSNNGRRTSTVLGLAGEPQGWRRPGKSFRSPAPQSLSLRSSSPV